MNIQHHTFLNGGFVLHRLPGINQDKTISAWFDVEGNVLDAEHMPSGRRVGRNTSYWFRLKTIGRVWRK